MSRGFNSLGRDQKWIKKFWTENVKEGILWE